MKRGPYHTLSGWPIGSEADMAYHRATGEQVPKDKPVVLGIETYGMGFFNRDRAVITVGSYADLDKLAELDLPEGVEVVVADEGLVPEGTAYAVTPQLPDIDDLKAKFGRVALQMSAAAVAAQTMATAFVEAGRVMGDMAQTYTRPTGAPQSSNVLWIDEASELKPMAWDYPLHGFPDYLRHTPREETGKWRGRDREHKLRVNKNRARNKAARKARRRK